jgi:hypothetical protein
MQARPVGCYKTRYTYRIFPKQDISFIICYFVVFGFCEISLVQRVKKFVTKFVLFSLIISCHLQSKIICGEIYSKGKRVIDGCW